VSYSRLVLGDRFGTVLTELKADIEFVNWRKNNIGKAKFMIAATDPKATATNLRYGNRVLFEFENGLPDWGGVIDPPRTWLDGKITVTAYSAAYLFTYRTTAKGRYFTNQSVGDIFKALINEANNIEDTGVVIGTIWTGGTNHSPDYHFKKLFEIFQKSLTSRLSTGDFEFIPTIIDGKIKFTANFYASRGTNKINTVLIQDKNLSNIKLKEQGPIINSWDAVGEGTTWGDDRLDSNATDLDSVSLYGLREGSKVYGDVSNQITLDDNTANLLSVSKDIYNIFTLGALNKSPAKFADYDIGDVVSLVAPDYCFGGTETTIRILSREFSPRTGKCALVVQEQM
jgi:hypothetical protein